jgi:hypothetical protein
VSDSTRSADWTQPPAKKRRGCLPIIGFVFALIVIGIVVAALVGGGDDNATNSSKPADAGKTQAEEVTVSACGSPDAIGVVYVDGVVDNTSSKRSDYFIDVTVTAADGTQIGTGSTIAENVEPGQKALWKALTDTPSERWDGGATCKVVKVERNASL